MTMESRYYVEHDPRYHRPPLATVVTPSQHDYPSNMRHSVSPSSPLSTDRYSPDDSGYLGQVYGHGVDDYHSSHAHRAQQHQKTSNDLNTERQTRLPQNQRSHFPVQHRNNKSVQKHHANKKKNPSQVHNALTWRMDPAESLSDFKLIVIGINDNTAVNRRKLCPSNQKRRQKWNVEGLFLDMSGSEDERDDCHNHIDKMPRDYDFRMAKSNYLIQKEYNLHKVNLAVGPRSCEYFTHLFQRQQQLKSKDVDSSQHTIELPISCISAFSVMLDYIYAPQGQDQVHATTESAVSLRYLATVFGNRSLFDSATDFIQNDLRPETAVDYLLQAHLYNQKKLRNVCVQICAEEFDRMKLRHLAMVPPRLLESIMYSKHFHSLDDYGLCSKIAAYCRCQEHNINGPTLLSLTDARVLPQIYPEEALFFIKFMIALGMDIYRDSDQGQHQCEIRNLYERCVGAAPAVVHEVLDSICSGAGHDLGLDDTRISNVHTRQNKMACADYRQLPPQVKVDLLEYALAKHQNGV